MDPSWITTGTDSAAPSSTRESASWAVTVTVSVWPSLTLVLSTLRSMVSAVSASLIVSDAPFTVSEPEAPLTARTSDSPATLSFAVVRVKEPDPEPAPAAISTSKVSSPAVIE